MAALEVPVLVVGGGGCGLCTSVFLSDHGVDHLLVERHLKTSTAPKAHYINQRTMEIFRQHGLAEAVTEVGAPIEKFGNVRWQTTLAGDGPLDARLIYEMEGFGGGSLRETYEADAPVLASNLPQMRLEPILRAHAETRAPGRIRFGHELVSFASDGEGVTAAVRDTVSGETTTVVARYLVAADAGKTVGPALGVQMQGLAGLADISTAHFSADLSRWWHDGALVTWFMNPERPDLAGGALVEMGPTWGSESEEWGLHFVFPATDPGRSEAAAAATRIREILGIPDDLELTVHSVSHWVLEAVLADRYRVGRVLLAGDAVHRLPPATGLGLNIGIHDAHNLAWKLAAVLSGQAGEELLDSYEAERRPVGRHNVSWAMSASSHLPIIMDAAIGLGPNIPPQLRVPMFSTYFDESPLGEVVRARAAEIFRTHRAECQCHDVEIGFVYGAGAVVPDGTPPPPRSPLGNVYHPTTYPGSILPHAWLEGEGTRVSTHDLTGSGIRFVLITGPGGTAWREAAAEVAEKFSVEIVTSFVGEGADWVNPDGRWRRVRAIDDTGAVLVRPDNHIAWRSTAAVDKPTDVLTGVMQQILRR